jgi:protein-S-isoprenylcysteine O-methyltransferase Ste14
MAAYMPLSAADPGSGYGVVFAVSFCCWLGLEIWVFWRERRSQGRTSRGNEPRLMLTIAAGIVLGLNMPALAPPFNIGGQPLLHFAPGILLIWAGLFLRFWSIQTLGRYFSTKLAIQEGHELITTGPYKHLRNPSYTAALMTFTGIGLSVGNWLSILVLLLTGLLLYVGRIKTEERMLLEQFGPAFEDYRKRTWALIPFVW